MAVWRIGLRLHSTTCQPANAGQCGVAPGRADGVCRHSDKSLIFQSSDITMSEASNSETPRFAEGIAAAVAASEVVLPGLSTAERLKVHRIALRGIGRQLGLDGVAAYKAKHPEAHSIRVNVDALAYSHKPKGYDDYLVQLVERWLTNNDALTSTNVVEVGLLNERFSSLFDPAKHFSQPLSNSRLKKIKAVFSRHNFPLDTAKATTMSKVREAAKAVRARINSDRPFGNVGTISGSTLVIGQQTFAIELNGKRECIRVVVGNNRPRFYLDGLEWLANLMTIESDHLSHTTISSIGELPYPAETTEIKPDEQGETLDLSYGRGSLDDRLAALKGDDAPASDVCPDGVDPLTL